MVGRSRQSGKERQMAFSSLCRSDPLLDFIRTTYGAIPLRVPDQRFQPLGLFTVQERHARYLGTLADLALDPAWPVPRTSNSDLADTTAKTSNQMACKALRLPYNARASLV
jgi:hypothetical protein